VTIDTLNKIKYNWAQYCCGRRTGSNENSFRLWSGEIYEQLDNVLWKSKWHSTSRWRPDTRFLRLPLLSLFFHGLIIIDEPSFRRLHKIKKKNLISHSHRSWLNKLLHWSKVYTKEITFHWCKVHRPKQDRPGLEANQRKYISKYAVETGNQLFFDD